MDAESNPSITEDLDVLIQRSQAFDLDSVIGNTVIFPRQQEQRGTPVSERYARDHPTRAMSSCGPWAKDLASVETRLQQELSWLEQNLRREIYELRTEIRACDKRCGMEGPWQNSDVPASLDITMSAESREAATENQDHTKHSEDAHEKDSEEDVDEKDSFRRHSIFHWKDLELWRLEQGEMYRIEESIWDATTFAFCQYIPTSISISITFLAALNTIIQIAFVVIVFGSSMLENPVDSEKMHGLLRFRASVAHSIANADEISMTSMTSQLCADGSLNTKLHISGKQASLFEDMSEFYSGAMMLCIMAQFAWVATILRDMNDNLLYCRALFSCKLGPKLIMQTDAPKTEEINGGLFYSKVVIRLHQMTAGRRLACVLFVALPRLAISLSLLYTGILYLAVTTNMGELILNTIALAFIIDLDNLIFKVFAPHRIHTLIINSEPLPCVSSRFGICWPSFYSTVKFFAATALVLYIVIFLTVPFFQNLEQATDLLCSGRNDFVYTSSAANGMVYAAKSRVLDELTEAEKDVIRLAQPKIHTEFGWGKELMDTVEGRQIVNLSRSKAPTAVIWDPTTSHRRDSITEAQFSKEGFAFISSLQRMTVSDSEFLPCTDMASGQSPEVTLVKLRKIVKNDSAPPCDEEDSSSVSFYSPFCQDPKYVQLRAICPRTCRCITPLSPSTGFFQHATWGCPPSCTSLLRAINYGQEVFDDAGPCIDVPTPVFLMDTEDRAIKSWFTTWIHGAFAYMRMLPGFADNVFINAKQLFRFLQLQYADEDSLQTYLNYFKEGADFPNMFANGTWDLWPGGPPHPRHLKGCEYLTSFEIRWLWSLDFCDQTNFAGLRFVCPVSCGCGAMDGCPPACVKAAKETPCTDNMDGQRPEEATQLTLAGITENSSIRRCEDIPDEFLENCGRLEMRSLREICPMRCQCHESIGEFAGLFGSGDWGCPESCSALRSAVNDYFYEFGLLPHCTNLRDDELIPTTSGVDYYDIPDEDEVSRLQARKPLWFRQWLTGLFEYLMSDLTSFTAIVSGNVLFAGRAGLLPFDLVENLTAHILSGGMRDTILGGTWAYMPGVPNPNGKTGCAFLTDLMTKWVLGVDPCDATHFRSLRFYCPESCGCGAMDGCPTACKPSNLKIGASKPLALPEDAAMNEMSERDDAGVSPNATQAGCDICAGRAPIMGKTYFDVSTNAETFCTDAYAYCSMSDCGVCETLQTFFAECCS